MKIYVRKHYFVKLVRNSCCHSVHLEVFSCRIRSLHISPILHSMLQSIFELYRLQFQHRLLVHDLESFQLTKPWVSTGLNYSRIASGFYRIVLLNCSSIASHCSRLASVWCAKRRAMVRWAHSLTTTACHDSLHDSMLGCKHHSYVCRSTVGVNYLTCCHVVILVSEDYRSSQVHCYGLTVPSWSPSDGSCRKRCLALIIPGSSSFLQVSWSLLPTVYPCRPFDS